MPKYYRPRVAAKAKAARRRRYAKKNYNTRLATVAMVKRLVHKGREDKMCSRKVLESVSFNSTITAGDVYSLLPQVPNGNQDYERIGDAIQPKSLVVKGELGLNDFSQVDTKPLIVRVMILTQRDIKSEGNITTFAWQSLLRVNDPQSGVYDKPYDADSDNNLFPINKNLFTVHYDKKFYMAPTGDASVENRLRQHKFFTKKIRCPKNLIWDSSATINPQFCRNFCPFIVIGYQYADNQGGDTVNTRIMANVRSFLTYEDA